MSVSFLTQEGYDELQNELDYLRNVKRKEVAQRLHEAMEGGELIENAEYEAAKNEQAFTEGRIKELEYLLATARIVTEVSKSRYDSSRFQSDNRRRRLRRRRIVYHRRRSRSQAQFR